MDRLRQALWFLHLLNKELNPYARIAEVKAQLCDRDEQIAALKVEAQTAHENSVTDPMTGLANRRGRDETLERIFAEIETNGPGRRSSDIKADGLAPNPKMVVVIAFDLDRFKSVNDDYSHAVGDQALHKVAEEIKRYFRRKSDYVLARDGGEEMSVTFVCGVDSFDDTLIMGEEVRAAIQRHCHVAKGKREITTSIGIGYKTVDEQADISSILSDVREYADTALRAAKEAGRNRVYWHHSAKDISVASPLNPRHTVADIGVGRPGAASSAPQFAPS